ncbi:unnamed protein product [Kluyveromyces dobzhanskii CBS 2104]|uniref:Ubiquinone biosynthesis O-methyltransferase, mitochondrial n=1 Tax=Kluyveromyces dobzhanskii CBS 2104 TaxID=1427455 RepID=A0A0A8L3K3_9SACH|nr:unnamed protein product [Kluyveromyces dobzhanskii CBS 2104]
MSSRTRLFAPLKRCYSEIPKYNTEFIKSSSSTSLPSAEHATTSNTGKASGTSASEDEIFHFQQLAPTWWDTWGSQRILHKMNLVRMDFFQRTIRNEMKIRNDDVYIPGFNHRDHLPSYVTKAIDQDIFKEVQKELAKNKFDVLDIGCGGGILSESLGRLPFIQSVTAIDLAPECIEVAKAHAAKDPSIKDKIFYKYLPLEKVHGQYDIVTMFEMLEHVDEPSEILRQAWSKLQPNGIVFLSTINRDPVSWFTTIFMAEQVLKVVPKGTHHVDKYINSSEIKQWFEENLSGRYEILDTKGTMYLPLTGWVEHDCASVGNYSMAIKKLK